MSNMFVVTGQAWYNPVTQEIEAWWGTGGEWLNFWPRMEAGWWTPDGRY